MTSEAQKKASAKYEKSTIKRIVLKLNRNTDKDIIAYLDSLENIQGEIKKVLREHIKRH